MHHNEVAPRLVHSRGGNQLLGELLDPFAALTENPYGPHTAGGKAIEEIRIPKRWVRLEERRNPSPVLDDRHAAIARDRELNNERAAACLEVMEQLGPDDPLEAKIGVARLASNQRPDESHHIVRQTARGDRRRVGSVHQFERFVAVGTNTIRNPDRLRDDAVADDEHAFACVIAHRDQAIADGRSERNKDESPQRKTLEESGTSRKQRQQPSPSQFFDHETKYGPFSTLHRRDAADGSRTSPARRASC